MTGNMEKYTTYRHDAAILTEEEVEYLFITYMNENPESLWIVKGIVDDFKDYLSLKKGKQNAVVLKGSELREEILWQNLESGDE